MCLRLGSTPVQYIQGVGRMESGRRVLLLPLSLHQQHVNFPSLASLHASWRGNTRKNGMGWVTLAPPNTSLIFIDGAPVAVVAASLTETAGTAAGAAPGCCCCCCCGVVLPRALLSTGNPRSRSGGQGPGSREKAASWVGPRGAKSGCALEGKTSESGASSMPGPLHHQFQSDSSDGGGRACPSTHTRAHLRNSLPCGRPLR